MAVSVSRSGQNRILLTSTIVTVDGSDLTSTAETLRPVGPHNLLRSCVLSDLPGVYSSGALSQDLPEQTLPPSQNAECHDRMRRLAISNHAPSDSPAPMALGVLHFLLVAGTVVPSIIKMLSAVLAHFSRSILVCSTGENECTYIERLGGS